MTGRERRGAEESQDARGGTQTSTERSVGTLVNTQRQAEMYNKEAKNTRQKVGTMEECRSQTELREQNRRARRHSVRKNANEVHDNKLGGKSPRAEQVMVNTREHPKSHHRCY